jgi:hypothetical protein
LTHETKIHAFTRYRREGPRELRASDKPIRARESDRASACHSDRCNERRVVSPGQHADDGVKRGGVGDAQAIDEPWFLTSRAKLAVNRSAAPVDDDERAALRQAQNRRHDGVDRRRIFQQFAAQFEHGDH